MFKQEVNIPINGGGGFGLASSVLILFYFAVIAFFMSPLNTLEPSTIVRWTVDNRHILYFQPAVVLGILLFAPAIHALEERLKPDARLLAWTATRFGWVTMALLILMLMAQVFHIQANGFVWDAATSSGLVRITYNLPVMIDSARMPFHAGWLIITGLSMLGTRKFSKLLSWVTFIVGIGIAVSFLSFVWSVFWPRRFARSSGTSAMPSSPVHCYGRFGAVWSSC